MDEFGPYPGRAVMLTRLLSYRGLDADTADVRAVLDGVEPDPALVARLAPVVGLHTADLHAVLWTEVPEELTPLDAGAARTMRELVRDATEASVADALAFARSLPQHPRTPRDGFPPADRPIRPTLGGVLVRLLRNRNLDQIGMARTLASLTPTYLSVSTYAMIGAGRAELRPGWVADFAAVVDLDPGCLAALTGFPVPDPLPARAPMTGAYAELLWEMRRLTADQVAEVHALVRARAGR
ncbi:hypothetical protein SRB5_33850 [Streptomyces sp. RB5]|uniref:Uncharacterized protein n=1 Tax=Streptomyces smaragdinus TaxID=2585196 RepID=A0A7K0CJN8_9ACTN|nr:hypothetical protein [Streptomyces smaragdinus]MQY13242.1 hypothetical protein [Streptomyces smaragdinus]